MIHLYQRKKSRPSAKRLKEILTILVHYGLYDWVRQLRLTRRIPFVKKGPRAEPGTGSRWILVRKALEELGPTFVKFGQVLSTRSDILPPGLLLELQKLQDSVSPVPWDLVQTVLAAEYPQGTEAVFQTIDEQPIASASIAQVHEGYLKNGQKVAIKIQRPGINRIIQQDVNILRFIAKLAQKYIAEFALLDPQGVVEEFSKHIQKELDFSNELHNMLRFQSFFRKSRSVKIPVPYETWSTSRVLVMEYIHGTKLATILEDASDTWDKKRLARIGAEALLDMILINGYFHADPHPGNILVLKDGRLCLLDFGMTGTLHSKEQKHMIEVLVGVLDRDVERVTHGVLSLIPNQIHHGTTIKLEHDLEELIDQYVDLPLKYVNIGLFIQQLMHIIRMHNLAIPSKFLFMGKALTIMEGVGSQLNPDFNLISLMGPVSRKIAQRQINPDNLKKKALESGLDYLTLIQDWPQVTDQILKMVRDGKVKIQFVIQGIKPLEETIDGVGTRLIFGLVLAAVMVSSSLIIHAKLPPLVMGIPVIGIIGFAIAGLMSLGFLIFLLSRFMGK